ncbi:MAG: hypothetical protein ABI729_06395 [Chitinophagales bacterium]
MDENIKKKKTSRITIIVCVSLVIFFFVLQMLTKKPSVDNEIMIQAAKEINKKCPIMVDSITRFDNTVALTNNVFQFNYTITNADKLNYDTIQLQNAVRSLTQSALKTDSKYKLYRDNNTTLSFVYHDKNGSYLCSILMNSSDNK